MMVDIKKSVDDFLLQPLVFKEGYKIIVYREDGAAIVVGQDYFVELVVSQILKNMGRQLA